MGRGVAVDMIEQIGPEAALEWHMQFNCYPSINLAWKQAGLEAIDAVIGEEPDKPIDLADGETLRAIEIVNWMHLEAFVENGNAPLDDDLAFDAGEQIA